MVGSEKCVNRSIRADEEGMSQDPMDVMDVRRVNAVICRNSGALLKQR